MSEPGDYQLHDPDQLITPCLLVYPDIVQSNLEAAIRIVGDVDRLRPHVKTHKTPEVVKMQLEMGIQKHKCSTLREAAMVAAEGAQDVLIAYPQVGPAIRKLCEIVGQYPQTRFSTTVDSQTAIEQLSQCFAAQGAEIDVLLDIDNGMHRTGIPAGEEAFELYQMIARLPALHEAGLHVYDGQNHQPDLAERQQAVSVLMEPIAALVQRLLEAQLTVPKLVCGGTPTFPVFAAMEAPPGTSIECSPGTSVLHDYNYGRDYPDIQGLGHAAILMTRVISKQPNSGQFTCDLGHKAVAADPPAGQRCHFLGLPDAKEVKQNEEHLIVSAPGADTLQVGDVLYALPAHICPTVALHQHLQVIRAGQRIGQWEVTARDRFYT